MVTLGAESIYSILAAQSILKKYLSPVLNRLLVVTSVKRHKATYFYNDLLLEKSTDILKKPIRRKIGHHQMQCINILPQSMANSILKLSIQIISLEFLEKSFIKPMACIIKKFMTSILRHRTDLRRYLWRATMVIYLAQYEGLKTTL